MRPELLITCTHLKLTVIALIAFSSWASAQNSGAIPAPSSAPATRPLEIKPLDVKITYPNSNPFRDALKPVPPSAVFKMEGYYLWDPSVIKVGETYHLFCSRWPENQGMPGWKGSQVIRATSASLFGPYTFQQVVLSPTEHPWAKQGVHNPKITKVGKQFLLYHLGIPQWKTGFALADSIEGPWQPVAKPVISTNNPALIVRQNGTVYAVGKFKPKLGEDGRLKAYMQAFESPAVTGPYRLLKDAENRLPGDFELEDPTLWWANNQYNLVCTDWHAKITGIEKSVVFYTSKNGVDYELYSRIPLWSQNDVVPLEGGGTFTAAGVERPQVFTDEQSRVTALLVAVHPSQAIPTYIVIRPVDAFVPAN